MAANKESKVQVGFRFNNNQQDTFYIKACTGNKALVEFSATGYSRWASKCDILQGKIKDKYKPDKYGAYIGEGVYSSIDRKVYSCWKDMVLRCNSDKYPQYSEVSICEEWYNFQNFAEWYESAIIYVEDTVDLDKDLLGNGTLYSPETCCLLPHSVNMLMCCGFLPDASIWYNSKTRRYYARYSGKHLGTGSTYPDAETLYYTYLSAHTKLCITEYSGVLKENVIRRLKERVSILNIEKKVIQKINQSITVQKKELRLLGYKDKDISNETKRRECYREVLKGD